MAGKIEILLFFFERTIFGVSSCLFSLFLAGRGLRNSGAIQEGSQGVG